MSGKRLKGDFLTYNLMLRKLRKQTGAQSVTVVMSVASMRKSVSLTFNSIIKRGFFRVEATLTQPGRIALQSCVTSVTIKSTPNISPKISRVGQALK